VHETECLATSLALNANGIIEGAGVDPLALLGHHGSLEIGAVFKVDELPLAALAHPFVKKRGGDGSVGVVSLVLRNLVGESVRVGITNGESLEVNGVVIIVLDNLKSEGRHVVTTIALRSDVERVALDFREAFEKGENQLVVVNGSLSITSLVVRRVGTVGEPNTGRLLDEEHVGNLIPAELVRGQGTIGVGEERSLLSEESKKATASWPSVGPENNGIVHRFRLLKDDGKNRRVRRQDLQVDCQKLSKLTSDSKYM